MSALAAPSASHSRRRPAVLAALATVAAFALPLAGASPASADNWWNRPSDGVFRIVGRGFGHGHGLSQWGAYGAATQGRVHQTILRTYYPGTSLDKDSAGKTIRVLITGDDDGDLRVRPSSGLTAYGGGDSRLLPTTVAGHSVRAYIVDSNGTRLRDFWGGAWHTLWLGGSDHQPAGIAFANGAPLLTTVRPDGTWRDYRGSLAARPDGSAVRVVNSVDMESYLRSVVPSEMPASWPQAALRAQAVAARTYAEFSASDAASGARFDVYDSTASQVYTGVRDRSSSGSVISDHEWPGSDRAVTATAQKVLRYRGHYAFTQFTSANGGWSSQGSVFGAEVPYLPARADPWDGVVASSAHAWSTSFTAGSVERSWPTIGRLVRLRAVSRDGHGEFHGRVLSVSIVGSQSSVTVSGDSFRSELGLRSTWWQRA